MEPRPWGKEPVRPHGRLRVERHRTEGTPTASVLGDLAVVFRMNVPAQTDGQQYSQKLEKTNGSQHGQPGPRTLPPETGRLLKGAQRQTVPCLVSLSRMG